MNEKMFKGFFLTILFIVSVTCVKAQSSSSCYSKTGTISANIQVFHADKIDEPVVFDAGNSTGVGDFFKEPIEWDFGDGFKAKICRATHVYRNAGTYTVTLKVKNNQGTISTATTSVTISNIPAATGNNVLTVVTNGSGNGTTTFNTIQAAVNKAATINSSGTVEIIIPAGATFVENVELKVPQGNNYITLKSSALSNLPRLQRVNRSNLSNFVTIKSPQDNNDTPALRTELKNSTGGVCNTSQTCSPAHHYRLQGIQLTVDPGTMVYTYERIVAIGTDDPAQNSESEQAHHIIIDRCLVHREDYSASTNPNPQSVKNGVELEGKNLSVLDSYMTGINTPGIESHTVIAYNSTGTWGIINNYFESGGVEFFVGGAFPHIPNSVVQDVEFRYNRCHKPLEKRNLPSDHRWNVKTNFEIKSGRYWVIEENMFDGNWLGSNQFYNINLKTSFFDTGTQTILQDIQFTTNVIKQGPGGLSIAHLDAPPNAPLPARFQISNNLFTELGGAEYGTPPSCTVDCGEADGNGFLLSDVPIDLIIRHNTLYIRRSIMVLTGSSFYNPILFADNITNHGRPPYGDGWGYGIKGDGANPGCSTIDPALPTCNQVNSGGIAYLPGSTFNKNLITGTDFDSRYPGNSPYPNHSNNYYYPTQTPTNPQGNENIDYHFVNRAGGNYRISTNSAGKNGASDGTDVGANMNVLDLVAVNAVSGIWNTAPTQTPYPGPNPPNIPIKIEVENFDSGGQGVAYNENNGNTGGGTYRPGETVDIQARSTASNGYAIFEASAGEWLEYTINAPSAGIYDVAIAYASQFNNGKFHVEIDGVDVTGQMTANSTGWWGTFQTVTKTGVNISAGQHVVRLVLDTNSPDSCGCVVANFDSITFQASTNSVTWQNVVSTTSTGGNVQHAGTYYFGMAKTQQTIANAGYFEWTFDGRICLVGFGNNNDEANNGHHNDLDFAFSFGSPNGFGIREFGVYQDEGTAAIGDRFRIEIEADGDVVYKKNGNVIHTTTNPSKVYPYYLVFKAENVPPTPSISSTIIGFP